MAISGRINLYCTILVTHNNYACSTTPISRHDATCMFNTSDRRAGDGSASYFQTQASLPTAEETTLSDTVTQSANAAVLHEVQVKRPRKRKAYTAFTAEQRATIGKYAFEHGNAAAVKKFKCRLRRYSPFICSRSATLRN